VTLGKERGYMAAPSETRLWNFWRIRPPARVNC
jgi:hypothetical protein